jgi:hypothetical protein
VKTRWERYCELRAIDNWCLRNPVKANLLSCVVALVLFATSQLLQHLPPELLVTFVFGAWLHFFRAGVQQ